MRNALVVRQNHLPKENQKGRRAAQYVRMSTDYQQYSTENQAAAIAPMLMPTSSALRLRRELLSDAVSRRRRRLVRGLRAAWRRRRAPNRRSPNRRWPVDRHDLLRAGRPRPRRRPPDACGAGEQSGNDARSRRRQLRLEPCFN